MTEADPDAVGPDGTVRLRCYLPMANSLWFFADYPAARRSTVDAPAFHRPGMYECS